MAKSKRVFQKRDGGFTLIELMITLTILLTVSAIVLSLMFRMSMSQSSVATRTDMHASVRSVTEVMQQEISQAGRVTIPGDAGTPNRTTLTAAVATPAACPAVNAVSQAVSIGSTEGMFLGELLIIGPDPVAACDALAAEGKTNEEVVTVTAVDAGGGTITANFLFDHANGASVRPASSFGTGILASSDGNTLKMFGDINDTGNMVYVKYFCNPQADGSGTLTRQEMPWNNPDPANKDVDYPPQTLLNNVLPNPDGSDCFIYDHFDAGTPPLNTYVLNVAVTLSVQGEQPDLETHVYDKETKALLSVAPRNVNMAYRIGSQADAATGYVQPTPATITALE